MQLLQTNQCLRSIFRNALNIPIASVSTPLLNNFAAARPLGALRNRHSDPSPDGEEPAWSVPNLRKHMRRFAQQHSSDRPLRSAPAAGFQPPPGPPCWFPPGWTPCRQAFRPSFDDKVATVPGGPPPPPVWWFWNSVMGARQAAVGPLPFRASGIIGQY